MQKQRVTKLKLNIAPSELESTFYAVKAAFNHVCSIGHKEYDYAYRS